MTEDELHKLQIAISDWSDDRLGECGYSPSCRENDPQPIARIVARIECIARIAALTHYWRQKYDSLFNRAWHDKEISHFRRQNTALRAKVMNQRREIRNLAGALVLAKIESKSEAAARGTK